MAEIKIQSYINSFPKDDYFNFIIDNYNTFDNNIITHTFYDIFPIKKNKFEEYEISIPNKMDKVLESYNFDLKYITFTKKKEVNKKIIEEVETKNNINTLIKDNIYNFISVIKPFFFNVE
jgi:hypothetical protein